MNRTIVCADIHGSYKALMQCIERSGFDYEEDELIVLGDVADGYPQTYECFEELLKVKNLIYCIGNHDMWTLNWAKYNEQPMIWVSQGGYNTMMSYKVNNAGAMPQSHLDILENGNLWFEDDGILFVHGGIDINKKMENQTSNVCLWDRDLITYARRLHLREKLRTKDKKIKFIRPKLDTEFKEIFIGHTSTKCFKTAEPVHYCNVWDIDTGAGWGGKLTFMDVKTKEYWQSDLSKDLYPESQGRGDGR